MLQSRLFCFSCSARFPTLVAEAGARFVYFLFELGKILKFDTNSKIFYLYLHPEIFAAKFDISIVDVTSYAKLHNLVNTILNFILPINVMLYFFPCQKMRTAYMHNRTRYNSCLLVKNKKSIYLRASHTFILLFGNLLCLLVAYSCFQNVENMHYNIQH